MSVLAVQLETPGAGFLELSREELASAARTLAELWRSLGVAAGDRVLIYDYGSSPIVYLASAAFTPYLDSGAAERCDALALCVDGLPDNVGRLAHVLRLFAPGFLFLRAELAGLLIGGPTAIAEEDRRARLVVCCGEDAPAAGERAGWQRCWPGGVFVVCERPSRAGQLRGWEVV